MEDVSLVDLCISKSNSTPDISGGEFHLPYLWKLDWVPRHPQGLEEISRDTIFYRIHRPHTSPSNHTDMEEDHNLQSIHNPRDIGP